MLDAHDVIGAQEASEILQIHEETVRRLAREGQLPAFKVGGGWRFSRVALREWIEAQGSRSSPPLVLLVDDDMNVHLVVKHCLTGAGYAVVTASDGEEALAILEKAVPSVILMDLHMPGGMNGAATIGEIRRLYGQVPVIVITGYPDSDLMNEALAFGPIGLLSKPLDFAQLVAAVKMVTAGAAAASGT